LTKVTITQQPLTVKKNKAKIWIVITWNCLYLCTLHCLYNCSYYTHSTAYTAAYSYNAQLLMLIYTRSIACRLYCLYNCLVMERL